MPQYVKKLQKTRVCPRCNTMLDCTKLKGFDSTDNEAEAGEIVRSMKIPAEIEEKIYQLKKKFKSNSGAPVDKYRLFSDLITELLNIFPNALPLSSILQRASELGLNEADFIQDILTKMNENGLVLVKNDNRGNIIYKFPSLPVEFGKINIKKPIIK